MNKLQDYYRQPPQVQTIKTIVKGITTETWTVKDKNNTNLLLLPPLIRFLLEVGNKLFQYQVLIELPINL